MARPIDAYALNNDLVAWYNDAEDEKGKAVLRRVMQRVVQAPTLCVQGPCPDEAPSNADRIRAMSDEEMATELLTLFEELCEDGIPSADYMRFWLQQPVEEDT